ncbi:hypothetical protein [Aerosakkonema sp. BLCC-F183]|uniref:hypothetical protein n=1 Tax=Aerosakkonema sp. BLCC-F183 TaxID=3342834 RepID=UPI0035BC96CE
MTLPTLPDTKNPRRSLFWGLQKREAIALFFPQQKKPGFSDRLCFLTDILCKNPVSELQAIALQSFLQSAIAFSNSSFIKKIVFSTKQTRF